MTNNASGVQTNIDSNIFSEWKVGSLVIYALLIPEVICKFFIEGQFWKLVFTIFKRCSHVNLEVVVIYN